MNPTLPISIRRFWISVRASFWFIPALMLAVTFGLAVLMIYLDRSVDTGLSERFPALFATNAAGARSILAAIAGSMITVAGVTFSITIVALSLASNQYTPRILRNFMRDTGNQLVLGVFVSVFVYCLLVLRSIRGGEDSFIPSYALLVGIFLAIVAISFLIYFVHHIAGMVQASNILANIYQETMGVIEDLYPEPGQDRKMNLEEKVSFEISPRENASVLSTCTGYIQDIDESCLIAWAEENDAILEMVCGIGAFVIAGAPLVQVHGRGELDHASALDLNKCYSISQSRTTEQDPAFGIRQIVDVALKALSPGINDTTTAASCVDYLGAIIFKLGDCHIPPRHRCKGSRLRLVSCTASYESLVDESLHEIRQHARNNVAMYVKLLAAIQKAASPEFSSEKLDVLWRHAQLIIQRADLEIEPAADRALISDALAKTAAMLHKDDRPFLLPTRVGCDEAAVLTHGGGRNLP